MRTIQEGCAVVEIIAWPEDRPWEGRYQTSSSIERGICRLTLSPAVYHDAAKANTAYRRFAGKIERSGLVPPTVEFRTFVSEAAKRLFCVLTTREAVFNSDCKIGRMSLVETGEGERHRICAVLLDEPVIEPSAAPALESSLEPPPEVLREMAAEAEASESK